MLAIIRFKIGGELRFLSHAETMRVFQRACSRAGVKLKYSEGYNPHPRMSLVLPRSVGVESDDEMLCLQLDQGEEEIKTETLSKELPAGIEIIGSAVRQTTKVPQASMVRYSIPVQRRGLDERIGAVLKQDEILLERRNGGGSRGKKVDVRGFLESMNVLKEGVVVDCKVSGAGTIRIDEILNLLGLGIEDLQGPVRRASVKWDGFEW